MDDGVESEVADARRTPEEDASARQTKQVLDAAIAELARHLGVSERTVFRWIADDEAPRAALRSSPLWIRRGWRGFMTVIPPHCRAASARVPR